MIAYDNTSSQVLVQIGDYEFGNNLDQFVFGPRLVIYGDGSAFAEVDGDGVPNGAPVVRPIESRVSDAEIQSLLLAASKLPDVASASEAPEDGLPLLLAVNGQAWDILDFEVEPFNSYVRRFGDGGRDRIRGWHVDPAGMGSANTTGSRLRVRRRTRECALSTARRSTPTSRTLIHSAASPAEGQHAAG